MWYQNGSDYINMDRVQKLSVVAATPPGSGWYVSLQFPGALPGSDYQLGPVYPTRAAADEWARKLMYGHDTGVIVVTPPPA